MGKLALSSEEGHKKGEKLRRRQNPKRACLADSDFSNQKKSKGFSAATASRSTTPRRRLLPRSASFHGISSRAGIESSMFDSQSDCKVVGKKLFETGMAMYKVSSRRKEDRYPEGATHVRVCRRNQRNQRRRRFILAADTLRDTLLEAEEATRRAMVPLEGRWEGTPMGTTKSMDRVARTREVKSAVVPSRRLRARGATRRKRLVSRSQSSGEGEKS
jgi:hypothetical protein